MRFTFETYLINIIYSNLANFGGLVSITLGASVISAIELLYFGTGRFVAKCTGHSKNKIKVKQNYIKSTMKVKPVSGICRKPYPTYLNEFTRNVTYKSPRHF